MVEGRLSFYYAPAWLSHPDALALSASLPLQTEPFEDHRARPYFAGLLPEGQLRRLIAQRFQVSGQNDFALLDRIGGECAGAVTFLAPGQGLPSPGAHDDIQWLSDAEVIAVLDELPRRPRRRPRAQDASSPGGFTSAPTLRRILELAHSLPATARKLQSDPDRNFAGNVVVKRIIALIEQRCALTIRRLTEPSA